MKDDSFSSGYKDFVDSIGGQHSSQTASYISNIEAEIAKLQSNLNSFDGNRQYPNILKGDIAEIWHSGTHNIDAALKDVKSRTYVNATERNALGSTDIKSTFGEDYGLKYYKDGAHSAKEQAKSYFERYNESNAQGSYEEYYNSKNMNVNDSNKHDPLYGGQHRLIPVEQIEEATAWLERQIAKESVTRPDLVQKYKETLKLLTDRIKSSEGSESIPLTNKEAQEIARLAKNGAFKAEDYGLTTENLIEFQHIMQQSLKAGLSAAAISVVLRIAPELFNLLQKAIKSENIAVEDLKKLGIAALEGGRDGFIRGSVAAGLTTACLSGQLGSFLKSVDPTVIGAVTVITLNAITNSIKVARKEMTKQEFANACIRDLFITSVSLWMGSVSQAFIQIPVLGFLIGSFVGSLAASFIYDTGYKAILSFCCDSGCTFFGLVDQDYTLPDEVLKEIGIEVFDYEKIGIETFLFEEFTFEKFVPETKKLNMLDITFLRRGVIGINKIGYA